MTLAEIETYYGKESADWIREKILDGTLIPPAAAVQLRNPKCQQPFMTINQAAGYFDPETGLLGPLPDHLRYSDSVRVDIPTGPGV